MYSERKIRELKLMYRTIEGLMACATRLGVSCWDYNTCNDCYDKNTESHIYAILETGHACCRNIDEAPKEIQEICIAKGSCGECVEEIREIMKEDFKEKMRRLRDEKNVSNTRIGIDNDNFSVF